MQTFLPCPSFSLSAEVLDSQRLGKQRVECQQILNAIYRPNYGWQNHPAVNMWRDYPDALMHYANVIIREWIKRGYRNTMRIYRPQEQCTMPPWFGDDRVHESHKRNLIRKVPEYYGSLWPELQPQEGYYWPV